jgi:2-keto-4-pentenoate hydratase/2-oxohepta-3-ene-1,7-dioic acid hydratase in catechol pathway
MRLVCFSDAGRSRVGVVVGDDQVLPLDGVGDLVDLVGADDWMEVVDSACRGAARFGTFALTDLRLLPPVLRPTKVIGVGMNHHAFVEQLGEKIPEHPSLFHKTSSALNATGSPIILPAITEQLVPEAELAVVIGRRGYAFSATDAAHHIAGFTCANDLSARNLEFRTSQWTGGKMLPTSCPLGPWLVTTDEVDDPDDIRIRAVLNDRVVQDGSTADLVFGVHELLARISELVQLEPGDVVLTGTSSDLGETNPPVFLRSGDRIRVEIDGIGVLENPVVSQS